MSTWLEKIEKLVAEGKYVLDRLEDGKKVYKRVDVSRVNEWLINGVPRLKCAVAEQERVLAKWKFDGMSNDVCEEE
jgi:hypothetical protein